MAKLTLDGLTAQLTQAFGDALTAVVLYGSAARGERIDGRSDHNVLVIVRTVTPASLRAAAAASSAWGESGNPPPLVMTEAEWRSSRDVFAMEHADIDDRHRVLAGALPRQANAVATADLRHQLEFEAMGKLIRLRQGILACAGEPKRELDLLVSAKSGVLVLFRTLLRVHGDGVPDDVPEVVRRTAARAGFDPAPFLAVIAHASGGEQIAKARADAVLEAFHAGLRKFVAHVDAMVHPDHPATD
jgi:hypothetical protein